MLAGVLSRVYAVLRRSKSAAEAASEPRSGLGSGKTGVPTDRAREWRELLHVSYGVNCITVEILFGVVCNMIKNVSFSPTS